MCFDFPFSLLLNLELSPLRAIKNSQHMILCALAVKKIHKVP